MRLKRNFLSLIFSLALILGMTTPQQVFAADTITTTIVDNNSISARSGQAVGSSGGTYTGGGQITVPITVTGQKARTLKVIGSSPSGSTTIITVYGPGCGYGVRVPLNGTTQLVTDKMSVSGSATFTFGFDDAGTYRVAFLLFN